MKRVSEYWDRFWFSRFDPLSASVFRIFLGSLIVVMFVANSTNWNRFYDADGIPSVNDVDIIRPPADWWSVFYWTDGLIPTADYWWLGIVAAIAFTVGWQTRFFTIVLFVLECSMIHRNLAMVNGEDLTFRMLLFYSCFASLNRYLSVDSWLKKRRSRRIAQVKTTELPRIWPIRLMQINIALIYVISLPNKLADDYAWINGDAIYWTMTNVTWSRCPWPELFYKYDGLLSKIATYGTVLVEGAFPILVWFRKTKLVAIAAIASLHLGIAVMIPNVTFFTLSMVCSFWVFMPAPVTRRILARLRIVVPEPEPTGVDGT